MLVVVSRLVVVVVVVVTCRRLVEIVAVTIAPVAAIFCRLSSEYMYIETFRCWQPVFLVVVVVVVVSIINI